jgi:ComF family protein
MARLARHQLFFVPGLASDAYHNAMRLRELTRNVLEFCYPGVCANCNGACDGHVPLCELCRIDLHALEAAPACDKCAMPLPERGAPCAHCLGEGVYPFDKILRLGIFVDPLKNLIHQMKYHRQWGLAEFFADRLLAQPNVDALLKNSDLSIAVPLHPLRQIARGYNQADVLARRVAHKSKIRLVAPISRLKRTETQTHLSHAKRVENMHGAFGLRDASVVHEKHVVVIDDVMTSGATLQSIGRAIKQGKPASISAIVVARSDPKQRGFEVI